MKTFLIFSMSLTCLMEPAWAGTTLKAFLQSTTHPKDWANVEGVIDNDKIRVDFTGPTSHGSMIYDRESSLLTLVDHLHKTVLPVTSTDQTVLKLLLAMNASRMKGQTDRMNAETRKAFALAEESATAFFNGVPELKNQGVSLGGFSCDEYVTSLDGRKLREVWVEDPQKAGMSEKDYNTFRSLAHLAVDLFEDQLAQWGADTSSFRQNLSEPQLPIQEILYLKGKASARFKLIGLHSNPIEASHFDPPANYQVLSLLDLVKQGH